VESATRNPRAYSNGRGFTALTSILPYIEQGNLYQQVVGDHKADEEFGLF